jgi:hypothetical protein
MADDASDNLASWDAHQLAQRCAAQQQRFHQHQPSDDRYCLELFLRALYRRDELAWSLAYQQFFGTVLAWVHQHPCANLVLAYEEAETYATEAFSRFWVATRSDGDAPPRFPTLASILAFLKVCVNSVMLDKVRWLHTRQREGPLDPSIPLPTPPPGGRPEQELWALVERALPDRRERRLAYLLFVLDLKPREIVRAAPQDFPTAQEVYRLTRNILDRLRRNPALRRWREGDAI